MKIEQKDQAPMSIDEASTWLGLSKSTLYSKVCRREIPFVKCGKLYFFKEDLLKWLKGNSISPESPSYRVDQLLTKNGKS